eukprot:g18049.t1
MGGLVGVDSDSSHNCMPTSVWRNIRRWFGTVANDVDGAEAPTATQCVEVCFTINEDSTVYARPQVQLPLYVEKQLAQLKPEWRAGLVAFAQDHACHACSALASSGEEQVGMEPGGLSDEESQLLGAMEGAEPELMEDEVGEVAQQMHVTQAEYDYLLREHRRLGHSPAIVNLFTGPAKAALIEIRRQCRLCQLFDNAKEVRQRAALQQYAPYPNLIWIADLVSTPIGDCIKIIDACGRIRAAELIDAGAGAGGKVGAAIRCFWRMKVACQGVAKTLLYDQGSEFTGRKFRRAVVSQNCRPHGVAFKAAHRISKLERENGQQRQMINKIICKPYCPWLEVFLWSLAQEQVLSESLDGEDVSNVMREVLRVENNKNNWPSEFELKQEILQEAIYQLNSVPVLNTCLSAFNLMSGSLHRGIRDWEALHASFEDDPDINSMAEIDQFTWRKFYIQDGMRRSITKKDMENYCKRRELVGRSYKRGVKVEDFEVGQEVGVRRKNGKFAQYYEGTVKALDTAGNQVIAQKGNSTVPYPPKDVSGEKPAIGEGYEMELYPDEEYMDVILSRFNRQVPPEPSQSSSSSSNDDMGRKDTPAQEPDMKRFRSKTGNLYKTAAADPLLSQTADRRPVRMPPDTPLFVDGRASSFLLKALDDCVTEMSLQVEKGKIFLTPSRFVEPKTKWRQFDFSALLPLQQLLNDEREKGKQVNFTYKLMEDENRPCSMLSQLLNGREVQTVLNSKDNRTEIVYNCTAVEVGWERVPVGKLRGDHCFVAFGEDASPEFLEPATAAEHRPGCWVARVYFEHMESAHQGMKDFAADCKSSSIIMTDRDAEALGFMSYLYAACVGEVQAIDRHGVFGSRHSLDELAKGRKNLVSSRLLLTIKIDRTSGEIVKLKCRWISRGYEDRRFHRDRRVGEQPSCRSHTLHDQTLVLVVQFLQAMGVPPSIADIMEAFLQGILLEEAYADPTLQEVYIKVPKVLQRLHVPGVAIFGECVRLRKCLHGQSDAPLLWEKSLFAVLRRVGLTQSLVDPALFIYFPTDVEQRTVATGMQREYYMTKLGEIEKLDVTDVAGKVAILDSGASRKIDEQTPLADDPQLMAPRSITIANEVMPATQGSVKPCGAIGIHVDDTLGGGDLIFYLRLSVVYRRFPLGSWGQLHAGFRDTYVGREVVARPLCFDQRDLALELRDRAEELELADFQPPAGAETMPTEEELVEVEKIVGVGREVVAEEYPPIKTTSFDPWSVPDKNVLVVATVYLLSQETYIRKVKGITKTEVEEFQRKRKTTTNAFLFKQISNPFRGRVGELAWVMKCNAVILEALSTLAQTVHIVEKAEDWETVEEFVDDLNNLIGLAQNYGHSTIRVYRLGGLHEHFVIGSGDAGMKRVGGGTDLVALATIHNTPRTTFSKKPKRKASSSTGMEVLAMRMVTHEMVYTLQIAPDLHLCLHRRQLLALTDAKNLLGEPGEKNLKPDWSSINQLVDQGHLKAGHIPGKLNPFDVLTKTLRETKPIFLHFAKNKGLFDRRVLEVIHSFIDKVQADELEVAMLDEMELDDGADAVDATLNAEHYKQKAVVLGQPATKLNPEEAAAARLVWSFDHAPGHCKMMGGQRKGCRLLRSDVAMLLTGKEVTNQAAFLRCGYKFARTWDGHYRRDMSSKLLKFLHDGDEGDMNTEQAYEQGEAKCCLNIMWPGVVGRYDSETESDAEPEEVPLAGGQSLSGMWLPRAVDGTRLAIPSTIAPSLSADGRANRDKWIDEGADFFHAMLEEELSDVSYDEDDLFDGGDEHVLEADPDWVPRPGDELD